MITFKNRNFVYGFEKDEDFVVVDLTFDVITEKCVAAFYHTNVWPPKKGQRKGKWLFSNEVKNKSINLDLCDTGRYLLWSEDDTPIGRTAEELAEDAYGK